jgi:hypothetical protein
MESLISINEENELEIEHSPKKSLNKKKKRNKKNVSSINFLHKNLDIDDSNRLLVIHDPKKGRCLMAKSNLPAGTVIFKEFSKFVISKENKLCCNCCNSLNLQHLPQSSLDMNFFDELHPYAFYCSDICRDEFKSIRDFELLVVEQIEKIALNADCDVNLIKLVVRILSSYSNISNNEKLYNKIDGDVLISTTNGFLLLENHVEHQSIEWKNSILKAAEDIKSLLPKELIISSQEILEIASRININAYGCQDIYSFDNCLGVGVFPIIGLCVNHECHPNCSYSFIEGRLEVRAIKDICVDEEITVTYINPINCFSERQTILSNSRYFTCSCQRCSGYVNRLKKVFLNGSICYFILFYFFSHVLKIILIKINTCKDYDDHLLESFDTSIFSGYVDILMEGIYCNKCGRIKFFTIE